MRIRISDIAPGVNYLVKIRSTDGTNFSEWSRVFNISITSDSIAPKTPTGVVGSMTGTSFNLSWNAVTESSDDTPAKDLDHYEVLVSSSGTGTTKVYNTVDTKFQFTLELNREVFGSARANIGMSVRAVDKTGNASAYSSVSSQTNPAPANPTGLTGTPVVDGVSIKWTAVGDSDLLGYKVYSGTSAGVQSTLEWVGSSNSVVIPNIGYSTDRWYKVAAYDVFNTESVTPPVTGPHRPVSSATFDTTAPPVPSGLTASITTSLNALGPLTSVLVSWSAVTASDIAGYRVSYRSVGSSDWSYVDVDSITTSTKIDRITPYVEYEFRVRSYDYSANHSAWSSVFTTSSAATNSAPAQVTGLVGVAGASTVTVIWSESTDNDVKNGAGMYEVQLATNTGFTTDLQTIKTAAIVASFDTRQIPAGNRYVRVRAVDSLGLVGPYSSTITVNQTDLSATQSYTQSRGMNLFTNGTGILANDTNMTAFEFDPADKPFGGGSFKHTGTGSVTIFNDEIIPVDTNKSHVITVYGRQANPAQLGARTFIGFTGFDNDKLPISSTQHMYHANTLTTLAAPINPGDTTVTLTSSANWYNGTVATDKYIIFWDYVDGSGYAWPVSTYSRNTSGSDLWASGGISGNVITLRNPWPGPAKPAGTSLSNGRAGSSYKYNAASNVILPQTWTKYQGRMAGVDYSGTNITAMFSPGTAYIKLLILAHYPTLTASQNSTMAYAGISISEVDAGNLLPSTMPGDVVIANTLAGDRIIANTADANIIKANTSFINDIFVKSTFTMGDATTDGVIKSFDWVSNTTGWRLTKNTFEVNNGAISAGALKIQQGHNIVPYIYSSFESNSDSINQSITKEYAFVGVNTSMKVFGSQCIVHNWVVTATGGSRSKLFFAKNNTDYNIVVEPGKDYIVSVYCRPDNVKDTKVFVKGSNGTTYNLVINTSTPPAATTTRIYGVWTAPAGVTSILVGVDCDATVGTVGQFTNVYWDGLQVEEKWGALTTPSSWTPPGINTIIDGGTIGTGQIRSNQTIEVGGSSQPLWSINTQGNAQLGDVVVRGKIVVGTAGESAVNKAPSGGDFEVDAVGYSAYTVGGTGTAIVRTTTVGEVIAGTGSAKVTAAAGSKTALGISFSSATQYGAGIKLSLSFKIRSDAAGGTVEVNFINNSNALVHSATIVQSPAANTTYELNYDYLVEEGINVQSFRLYVGGTTSATAVVVDDVKLFDTVTLPESIVTSSNYQEGLSGWRIFGQGDVEFNSGVFRGTIGARTVTAQTLASEIVLSSVVKSGITGRRVEFGTNGIQLFDSEDSPIIDMPTDASKPVLVSGDFLASSLTISDQMAIRGEVNELAKAAIITIQSGTTAPQSPPAVTVSHENWNTSMPDPIFNTYRYGWAWDASNHGGCWITVGDVYGANASIWRYSRTTGEQIPWVGIEINNIRSGIGGVTVMGNVAYVIGTDASGTMRIEGRNITTGASVLNYTFISEPNRAGAPAIGNDGTKLMVAYVNNADKRVRFYTINTNGSGLTLYTTDLYFTTGVVDLSYIGYGTFDFGVNRYIVTRRSNTVHVINSDATLVASGSTIDFTSPGIIQGFTWADIGSGGNFYSHDAVSAKLYRHTGVSWAGPANSSTLSNWYVANTWYDSDSTGGTHETQISPIKKFTMTKRAMLTITTAPIPVRPIPNTTDDAVATGIYMARGSTTPAYTKFERQQFLSDGIRVAKYHDYGGISTNLPSPGVDATVQPPATNGFASLAGAPALIRNSDDKFRVYGDGAGNWGGISFSNTGIVTLSDSIVGAPMRMSQVTGSGSVSAITSTTGAVVPTPADVSFVFTAPQSGAMCIMVSGIVRSSASNEWCGIGFECRSGSNVGAGTVVQAWTTANSVMNYSTLYATGQRATILSGLTPGASYNVRAFAGVSSGTGNVGIVRFNYYPLF